MLEFNFAKVLDYYFAPTYYKNAAQCLIVTGTMPLRYEQASNWLWRQFQKSA